MRYKVGDRFTVVDARGHGIFNAGDVLILAADCRSVAPYFIRDGDQARGFARLDRLRWRSQDKKGRSMQTKTELIEENKSLSKQIRSLLSRRDWLARELSSLDDRITRKKQFVKDNKKAIKVA